MKRWILGSLVLTLAGCQANRPSPAAAPAPFDVVIEHGRVIDGTGSPWYQGDVGIRDGRIAAIGELAGQPATRRIDATGLVVAPGFIDMLGQSELTILVNPHLPSKIFQGITTEITGEGGSVAPLTDRWSRQDQVGYDHLKITPDWRTLDQYFARLEKQGMGINLATYVGATQVRRVVIGDDDRAPTPAELDRHEAAGGRGHAGGRGRRLDVAAVRAGALRDDRGARRAGVGGREVRRHLRHAHALGGRRRAAGPRRGHPHRPRGEDPGGDLAHQGRRQEQLGPDEGDRGQGGRGARRAAWT